MMAFMVVDVRHGYNCIEQEADFIYSRGSRGSSDYSICHQEVKLSVILKPFIQEGHVIIRSAITK